MNTVICRNCGNEVSPLTGRCTRCGLEAPSKRVRRHRVLGALAAIFIILFLTGTTWFAFRPTGAVSTQNLPNCDDEQVVTEVKHNSPYVVWAQDSGTKPISGLRDIRAGAWNAQRRMQYCTATAVTSTGSYVITYGLILAPTRQGRPWTVSIFPDDRAAAL